MNDHQLVFDSGCCKWFETADGEQCVEQLCSLHASAPGLLAACEAALGKLHESITDRALWPDLVGYECITYLVYEQVRRAIAQARGTEGRS